MKVSEDSKLIYHQGSHKRPTFITILPTFGMIPLEHHVATLRLASPLNAVSSIITIRGEEIGFARNYAVQQVLALPENKQPEFLFFYGDDMIPEWNALITLYDEAVSNSWDILSALYFMKQDGVPTPILWREGISGYMQEGRDYLLGEVVVSDIAGMDFTLIRTELFKSMTAPYFKTGPTGNIETDEIWLHTEDSWFCRKAKYEAKARIGVHTGVRVAHLDVNTLEVY